MIIQPKVRGFICTTAHPLGCFLSVKEQVDFVLSKEIFNGPKRVLVIGSSTGYGLASRIVSAFGSNAKTIGVFYERESENNRTASPGWYNSAAFEQLAKEKGLYAKSINGDAFSTEVKQRTAELIHRDLGQVDLIIYSVASPRRTHPVTLETFTSALKPIGKTYRSKTVDVFGNQIKEIAIEAATDAEINNTIAVMGGEDWEMWIDLLAKENLLASGVKTVAYSYIGPHETHDIYKDGTIGKAKDHLKQTAHTLCTKLKTLNGEAIVSVNKAVVTQASAAIPVVPLYIAILLKVMKEKGLEEGCTEQIYRLFTTFLYTDNPRPRDQEGYIRIDDYEMQKDVQEKVSDYWAQVNTENIMELTDIEGYRNEFYKLFGFSHANIDYNKEIDPVLPIPSINGT